MSSNVLLQQPQQMFPPGNVMCFVPGDQCSWEMEKMWRKWRSRRRWRISVDIDGETLVVVPCYVLEKPEEVEETTSGSRGPNPDAA